MSAGRAALGDQRGLAAVEWIALGLVLLVLISGVDAVLYQNAQLRNAIGAGTTLYARGFGQDVTGYAPRLPDPPDPTVAIGAAEAYGAIGAPDAPPATIEEAHIRHNADAARLRLPAAFRATLVDPRTPAAVDPRSGVYRRLDPASRALITVGPGAGVRARFDAATGQITYRMPGGAHIATLQPHNNAAVLIDPTTSVRTPTDIETLWRLGMIEIRRDEAGEPAVWIARPTVGVPALFADWR